MRRNPLCSQRFAPVPENPGRVIGYFIVLSGVRYGCVIGGTIEDCVRPEHLARRRPFPPPEMPGLDVGARHRGDEEKSELFVTAEQASYSISVAIESTVIGAQPPIRLVWHDRVFSSEPASGGGARLGRDGETHRTGSPGSTQAAVAVGHLGEVLLVIVLGRVE